MVVKKIIRKGIVGMMLIFFGWTLFSQSVFDNYFEAKRLRVDFALSGNSQGQTAALQRLREEPVWGGPKKNLIDTFGYGGYYVKVYERQTKKKRNRGQTVFPYLSPKSLSSLNSLHVARRITNFIR